MELLLFPFLLSHLGLGAALGYVLLYIMCTICKEYIEPDCSERF